jgi:hypothetical protein
MLSFDMLALQKHKLRQKTTTTTTTDTETVPPPFLPHLVPTQGKNATRNTFGLCPVDHAVGNVLLDALNRISTHSRGFTDLPNLRRKMSALTVGSCLNSVILASDRKCALATQGTGTGEAKVANTDISQRK